MIIQDRTVAILMDHEEPSLIVYMSKRSPSPMDDVRGGPSTDDAGNTPASPFQPSATLLQPTPWRVTDKSNLLSPYVPTTPNQTPALSNDVPIGPVSSKGLIKGLEEAQNHTEDGVVVQSRFGTPAEQRAVRERMDRSRNRVKQWDDGHFQNEEEAAEDLRKRISKSKNLVREWDDGRLQGDGTGDKMEDSEMRMSPSFCTNLHVCMHVFVNPHATGDVPSDNELEDRRLAESEARLQTLSDKGKGPAITIEDETQKAEEERRRRDSAWKSRQGSLAESQGRRRNSR
ncbi:hypothetical protein J1614_006481 [Plenodomus biglobosus]|nr:hypothetical protein J1614_006481 [Plenodomus biglobosus]